MVRSLYSMGVRWTSLSSTRTRRRARSTFSAPTAKVVAPTAGRLLAAPERGPHAREQLAGRKGLADVVVGAGVERGDLVALLAARRQDDDGHGASTRAAGASTVSPSMSGSPRSRMIEVRLARSRLRETILPGRRPRRAGSRGPSSAARRKRRICGSSSISTTDGPRSTRHPPVSAIAGAREAAASVERKVKRNATPPSGRLCAQMRPPCARTIPRQIARPRPAPRGLSGAAR